MSRTFLQLCQSTVSDLGVAGGVLTSVSGGSLNQEQQRIVNWVARADLYIQNLWTDWNFLWYMDQAASGAAGTDYITPSLPSNADSIHSIDKLSVYIDAGTVNARQVRWMDWNQFYRLYQMRVKSTETYPAFYSMDPSGKLWLSSKLASTKVFSMSYWFNPKGMTQGTDTSPIPTRFDTIIVERAKIIYAQREDAPEILNGSTAEYMDQLDKMQAYCLPHNEAGRKLSNDSITTPDAYVE